VAGCLFCGGSPLTREHIWPEWLSKELPALELTTFTLERAGKETETWKAPAASTTVRAVCAICNGGWMSDLEARAAPLLTPLIRGQTPRMGRPSQAAVAAWALKTAVMLDQMNPSLPIRREHLDHLRDHGETHPTVHVFAAAYDGKGPEDTLSRSTILDLHVDSESGYPREAYVATLAIRHLALQVTGSGILESDWVHGAPLDAYVRRISPPIGRFKWPPGKILTREGLLALADNWRG
jgi:hypothetical protein